MSSEGAANARGKLYLVPNLLGDGDPDRVLPPETRRIVHGLSYYIAENPKAARAFLKRCGTALPIQEIRIERIPESAEADVLQGLLLRWFLRTRRLWGAAGGSASNAR